MKKISWFRYSVWIGIVTISNLQAQWLLGLRSGLSVAHGTADARNIPYTQTENLGGYSGGVLSQLYFSEHIAIQTELLYTQRGHKILKYYDASRFEQKNTEFMSQWHLRMHTVEMPLLFQYLSENDTWKSFVESGFIPAYWLSGTQKAELFINPLGASTMQHLTFREVYAFDTDMRTDGKKDRRWLFFGSLGTGLSYKWKLIEVGAAFRYYIPLNDRYAYANKKEEYDKPYRARTWSLSLQCLIPIRRRYSVPEPEITDDE